MQDRPFDAAVALLRMRRRRRCLRLRHENRRRQFPRCSAFARRTRACRHQGNGPPKRLVQPQATAARRVRCNRRVLPCAAHARQVEQSCCGALVPRLARDGRQHSQEMAFGICARAHGAREAPYGQRLHGRRDDSSQRGACRRQRAAARPVLQPYHLPHQRSARRVHRIRWSRNRQRRAEISELAGNAAVPQVKRALRFGQGQERHDEHGRRHNSRGLH